MGVEAGLSMLVSGKKALGGDKSQNSLPNKKFKARCLPKNRIYLDSCYTYISLSNEELLEDIRHINTVLLGHTNAGNSKTNWVSNYGGVESWINVSGISNIFSIPDQNNLRYHITYESYDGYYLVTNRNTYIATKFI